MKRKKVCIITGSRAEWGLFYPLARELRKNGKYFSLQILATGGHLSRKFGSTYKEIEKDGFRINGKAEMLLPGETEVAIASSVALGVKEITKTLKALKPELVFLLGDRFEIFAAATAALFLKIPIAHIHGGELTGGSLDDCLRHAITKMSDLHFSSTATYRKRVIQMGERPENVFNVGALGLDNIRKTRLLDKKSFEKETRFPLGAKNVMVTFNPSTLEKKDISREQFKNLLRVIDDLEDTRIILTNPNPDMYSEMIRALINAYVVRNRGKAVSFASMGRRLYLSSLRFMDAVLGNSSSGIIEAPSFGIPTVNIGTRQEGRLKPASVIDAGGNLDAIKKAVNRAFSRRFREKCRGVKNPYGDGNAAEKIVSVIRKIDVFLKKKSFYDLPCATSKRREGRK